MGNTKDSQKSNSETKFWKSYGSADSSIYDVRDFRDVKFRELYGDDFSKRNKRKFKKYLESEQGLKDWDKFDRQEHNSYMVNLDNRFNKASQNAKTALNTYSSSNNTPVAQNTYYEPTNSTQNVTTPNNSQTVEDLTKYGFIDVEHLKRWQDQQNLPKTGVFDDATKAKYDSLSKPNQITSTTMSLIPKKQLLTVQDYERSKYFKKPRTEFTSVTIDGKKYPIFVMKNTYFGTGKGKEGNNQIYAVNPETGMMRRVDTTWLGHVSNNWSKDPGGDEWFYPSSMFKPEQVWLRNNPMPLPSDGIFLPEFAIWATDYETAKKVGFKKQGGIMNRIKYFQQGGPAPQQDIQQQVIQLVQAAMSGDEKATQTVNQIMEAAKAGDQQASQIAQMIQEVIKQMQGQATSAKWGAKLGYIRSLKFANGGKTCPACQQGATFKKEKTFTKSNKKVEEKACGGKTKKRYFGGWL